jgi:hypothetical protein
LSGVLMTIFRVCGNGDYGVCYVSQHEEISMRAPRFCVAYQAPHAVAGDGSHAVARDRTRAVAGDGTQRSPQKRPMWSPQTEPTRSPETDPMRSPQTGARTRVPRPPPVELNAEGQALRERLRAFRAFCTQAVKKNYMGLHPYNPLKRTYLGLVQRPRESF